MNRTGLVLTTAAALLAAASCVSQNRIGVIEPDGTAIVDAGSGADTASGGDSATTSDASAQDHSVVTDAAGTDAAAPDTAAADAAAADTAVSDTALPDTTTPVDAAGTDTASPDDAATAGDSSGGEDSALGDGPAVDPCTPNPCTDPNRGICQDDSGQPLCLCDSGFVDYGDGTCRPEQPCVPSPCTEPNRTVCVATLGVALCYCDEGYADPGTGECQPVQSCTPNPCVQANRTQCSLVDSQVECACDPGYVDDGAGLCVPTGSDPCAPNPCSEPNRGVCTDVGGQAVCSCDTDFEEDGLGGCIAVVTPPCQDQSCGTAISGRVTHGGAPIPGMAVSAYQGDCPLGSFVKSAVSDDAGYYVLDSLSPTTEHYVRAAMGADARWWNAAGGSSNCLARDLVSLVAGEATTGVDFTYPAGGAISGRITASGVGVGPGFQIKLHRQLCGGGTLSAEVLTDANGDFLGRGLPEGAFYVEACATCRAGFEAYANRWWNSGSGSGDCAAASQVQVTAHTTTSGVDVFLETPAQISGTITLDSNPASGVLVHAYSGSCSSGSYVDGAFSVSDGSFHLPNLPAGSFYLETRMRSLVSPRYADMWWESGGGTLDCALAEASAVASGESLGGRDFNLIRGGSVSGQITASATPVAGIYVWAHVNDCARGDQRAWFQPALTDASGNYVVEALPPGEVLIYVSPQEAHPGVLGWYDGSTGVADCSSGTPVTVTDATDTSGIDLAF